MSNFIVIHLFLAFIKYFSDILKTPSNVGIDIYFSILTYRQNKI